MPERLGALDLIRGVAVMGILLPNIVSFGLPSDAYGDPRVWGSDATANLATWAVTFVLAEGKMRGLFSMLFGASLLLIAERAEASGRSAVRVHLARLAVLALIGLAHGYLIWSGDILFTYAVSGMIALAAWRLPTRSLLALFAVLTLGQVMTGVATWHAARSFEARAATAGPSSAVAAQWRTFARAITPSVETSAREVATYRGDWQTVSRARVATTAEDQHGALLVVVPETLGMMLLGMALFRSGFFAGTWGAARYRRIAGATLATALPAYVALAWWSAAHGFDPIAAILTEALHLGLIRPPLAIGYAALLVLWAGSAKGAWLRERIAAAGRAAFTNYLGTSIVCTLLFYGYGLAWFGLLERWQLPLVVAAVWGAMLLWSKPWLRLFAYGPFEWAWRSLARFKPQPMRRIP